MSVKYFAHSEPKMDEINISNDKTIKLEFKISINNAVHLINAYQILESEGDWNWAYEYWLPDARNSIEYLTFLFDDLQDERETILTQQQKTE